MSRHALLFSIAMALLGAAAVLIAVKPGGGMAHEAALELLPMVVGGWSGSDHVPTEVLPRDPRASEDLVRTYRAGADLVWVSIGYYPDQGEGSRPASRALLFPGRGWDTLEERAVRVPLDGNSGRSIPATLVVQTTADRRFAILYWYQVGRRSIASDHWYRATALYSRVVHGRADGALVRIAAPLSEGADPATAVAVQTRFVQALYPELLRSLVR
jgi:EpsI family protein